MRRVLVSAALLSVIVTAPAWAQTEPMSPSPSASTGTTVDDRANDAVDNDDDGFDMGWIGLLGLLGLAGLTGRNRSNERVNAHDTVTTRRS